MPYGEPPGTSGRDAFFGYMVAHYFKGDGATGLPLAQSMRLAAADLAEYDVELERLQSIPRLPK